MKRSFWIAMIAIVWLVAGCNCNNGPPPPTVVDPPDPINMVGRELYLNYNASAMMRPASYTMWTSVGNIEVYGGDVVTPGVTYVFAVPKTEGQPSAHIYPATYQQGRLLIDEDLLVPIPVREDTTYSHSDVRFWKVKPNTDVAAPSVLTIEWQARDVEGNAFPFRRYYRILVR
ncbi:MAG: hypothetical protein PHR51_02845 [Patescibacteria group bacterium]|nr:hypothetical protein [Patescibacteria group bacterium]